jgi:hypothetical protein
MSWAIVKIYNNIKMKKIIIILSFIIFIFGSLVFIGFLKNRKKENTLPSLGTVEIAQSPPSSPVSLEEKKQNEAVQSFKKTYELLFDQTFIYLDLDYPWLYVYDPQNKVIKSINLENKKINEIYKVSNLKDAWISEDKTKIIVLTNKGFTFIDRKKDVVYKLSPYTKNFVFTTQLWLYLNDNKNISYLAKFQNGKITKIRDLGILNPEFVLLKNGILIYEKNSPLFLLEFENPSILKIFLDGQFFDVLTNKNKDLIFLVFRENDRWQSKIIDLSKKNKNLFSWATNKEKCSFDKVLVCALPINFNPEEWLIMNPSYDKKVIIFDPENGSLKEINLEEKFDFIKPKLTPLGIIAWDRLSAKFYLLKLD